MDNITICTLIISHPSKSDQFSYNALELDYNWVYDSNIYMLSRAAGPAYDSTNITTTADDNRQDHMISEFNPALRSTCVNTDTPIDSDYLTSKIFEHKSPEEIERRIKQHYNDIEQLSKYDYLDTTCSHSNFGPHLQERDSKTMYEDYERRMQSYKL